MAIKITPELLAQHDRPGPRYTSYPTAVEFHEGVTARDYETRLERARERAAEPLSLYLHLPFCDHRCLFCGCHVIVSPHKERALPYLELLAREIDLVADRLGPRRGVSQVHLGGGTPTYFTPSQLQGLLGKLFERFRPVPGAEIAVEVDPRVTTTEHIDTLAGLGFNRMSLGLQDLAPEVQQAVERIQTLEETQSLLRRGRSHGFTGINIDLIYGLPRQTREGFSRTLDAVVALGPDRVAVYSFAYVPWIRAHMRRIDDSTLPDPGEKYGLLATAREKLQEAGYLAIGMDHFARPDDELARARAAGRLRRNFQGYTVLPADEVVGLGISAIGDLGGGYFQNEKKLSAYREALEQGRLPIERGILRSDDDEIRRQVILELMCNGAVDPGAVAERHGIDFDAYFAVDLERLRVYEKDGFVTIAPDAIRATEIGEAFIRNLAMCFDRYWREKHEAEAKPVFSRTI